MPRQTKKLTALEIKNLKPKKGQKRPLNHYEGQVPGLALQVTPKGGKSWVFRYMSPALKKQREMGLGTYPEVTLGEARDLATDLRKQVRQRVDPLNRKEGKDTFEAAAKQYLELKAEEWKNPKDYPRWLNQFETVVFPRLGARQLSDITTSDIIDVLGTPPKKEKSDTSTQNDDKPALSPWKAKPETAKRLLGHINNVFIWAIASEIIPGPNPCPTKKHADIVLGKIAKGKNFSALPFAEMPGFYKLLCSYDRMAATALRFTILTACRTSEVIEAPWSEFDLPNKLWTIPKERMKAGREHRVPLSPEAIKILEKMPRIEGNPYVFFGQKKNKPLSNMAMLTFLQKDKGLSRPDITVHGVRSCFRDWAAETTSHPHAVCEMALAHVIENKSEAAYRRGDLLEKRRDLMDDWATYCLSAT